jgi:transcriptional regulator with XRE-family HTH domain
MANKGGIIEKIVAEIDWYTIEKVRELRKPRFSQAALSREIGFSEGFIGRIENPKQSAVYSLRHLNLIAKVLKVNLSDLLPKQPLSNDLTRFDILIGDPTKRKTGEPNYKVIKKTALTEDEIRKYNIAILSRPARSGEPSKLKKRKSAKNNTKKIQ